MDPAYVEGHKTTCCQVHAGDIPASQSPVEKAEKLGHTQTRTENSQQKLQNHHQKEEDYLERQR